MSAGKVRVEDGIVLFAQRAAHCDGREHCALALRLGQLRAAFI